MRLPKCMMNTLCLCLAALIAAGPAVQGAQPPVSKTQQRITINLPPPGAPLGTVLKMITELSGMPLLTSPEIAKKPVSVYLPNVTGKQALDSVCEAHDLYYEQQIGTGLYVVKQIDSEVFILERANVTEIKDVVNVLVGEDLGQEVEVDAKNNLLAVRATKRGLDAVRQFIAKVDSRPRQNAAYFALEHVQAKDVKTVVEALVGEQGKVEADEKNNILAVDSTKGNIETIQQLITEVDVAPRQVLIEATLAELNDDASEELGILWNARFSYKGGARQTRFPFESKWLGGDSDVGWTFGEVSFKEFQVQLDAMETSGDAKVLASPRIRALHGEEAEINITTKTVVGTELSGEDETGLVNVKPIYEDVGVSLKVVPMVHSDGNITLKVEPSVSTAKESSFFEEQVDTFNRTATTTVSVINGETIAIGGLLQNEETDKITKVPILGDIPLLGKAFTHSSKESKKSDLVVFLTLHIIEGAEGRGAEGANVEAPVFDATGLLVKYNTAVSLCNARSYITAEPLLRELLDTPLDASRKHKIKQYLAVIERERARFNVRTSEMTTPAPIPQPVLTPQTAPIPQPVLTPQTAPIPQSTVTPQPFLTPQPAPAPRPFLTPQTAPIPQSTVAPQAFLNPQPAPAPRPFLTPKPDPVRPVEQTTHQPDVQVPVVPAPVPPKKLPPSPTLIPPSMLPPPPLAPAPAQQQGAVAPPAEQLAVPTEQQVVAATIPAVEDRSPLPQAEAPDVSKTEQVSTVSAEESPPAPTGGTTADPPLGLAPMPTNFDDAAALYQRGDYAQARELFQILKQTEPEAGYAHRVDAYLTAIAERTKHLEAGLQATSALGAGEALASSDVTDDASVVSATAVDLTVEGAPAMPSDASVDVEGSITQAVAALPSSSADSSVTLAPFPMHEVTLEAPPVLASDAATPVNFSSVATQALNSALNPPVPKLPVIRAKPIPKAAEVNAATARTKTAEKNTTTARKKGRKSKFRRRRFAVVGAPAPPAAARTTSLITPSGVAAPLPGTAPTPTVRPARPASDPAYNQAVWLYQTGKFNQAKQALEKLVEDGRAALDQRQRAEGYLDIIAQLGK